MLYSDALNKIMSVPMFQRVGTSAFKPTLEGIEKLVNRLSNPQNSYLTIHIAGTNGKGSIANMLSSVLIESGYRVGCYTSPHLCDYRERVRINGEMVDTDVVADFVSEVEDIVDNHHPSFFEITTALAFYAFKRGEVDIAIIETGVGGLTDSTNIINPILSIITNVSYDHRSLLGDTLQDIAYQKGGIIKPYTPVVIGERDDASDKVFETIAMNLNADIVFAEDRFSVTSNDLNGEVELNGGAYYLNMGLKGSCQHKNIVTLVAAYEELVKAGLNISINHLKLGVNRVCENMNFEGRWQTLFDQPRVICDTGHNYAGVKQVARQLATITEGRLFIVFGVMADKEVNEILELLPKSAQYIYVMAENPRAMCSSELLAEARKLGLDGECYSSVADGYSRALEQAESCDTIFVGGSTFVVADLLLHIKQQ